VASQNSTERQSGNSDLLTRREAAEYLGVAPGTLAIWKSAERYDLPVIKVGRLVRYRRVDLDNFLRNRTVESESNDCLAERQQRSSKAPFAPKAVEQKKVSGRGVEFAQVHLVEQREHEILDSQNRTDSEAIEVVLPSGIMLRLPPGCSLELLSSVVAILENR
jgi:excisionase family DNA binding protein